MNLFDRAVQTESPDEEQIPPFHIAIPVNDLEKSKRFYGEILGCSEGRSRKDHWVDYNFWGHQLVCHFTSPDFTPHECCNHVDKYDVPVPHFGLALRVDQWQQLAERLKKHEEVKFIIEPHLRFEGQPGEQWTMFFKDPTGNNLEVKAMTNPDSLFKKYSVSH